LVLAHRRANLGTAATVAFLISAAAYGWVRSLAIRWLSETRLGEVPYHLDRPLATLAGVPLQELLGWTSAAGLAGYLADRVLRRLLGSASAWSTALVAGAGMAAVCLAVESAAVVTRCVQPVHHCTSVVVAGPNARSQRSTSAAADAFGSRPAMPPSTHASVGAHRYWLLIHVPIGCVRMIVPSTPRSSSTRTCACCVDS